MVGSFERDSDPSGAKKGTFLTSWPLLVCCLGLEYKVQTRHFYHLCIDIKHR